MFARIAKFFRKSVAPIAPVDPIHVWTPKAHEPMGIDGILDNGGRLGFGSTNPAAYTGSVETKAYDSNAFLGRTGFGGRVDY